MTFTPSDPTSGAAARCDLGYQIGWDHARHGIVPPPEHLHPANPVRQGWQAARELFAGRALRTDRHVRQWLQLRLHAWRHGRGFESAQVNAALLRHIDVTHCPITREALSQDVASLSAASVDRVCDKAAYAAGNLAVMSRRANQAKGRLGVHDALHRARRADAEGLARIEGLGGEQWQRVAVLCAFATPLPHHQAAQLPLLVLPPPRLRVLNPVQSLQVVLSLQFTAAGDARRCAALAERLPGAETRLAFNGFMHTLLARRLARGRLAEHQAERWAIEDLWREQLVMQRWQRLALRLDEAACENLVHTAIETGLAGQHLRWLPQAAATDGWALHGQAVTETLDAAVATSASGSGMARAAAGHRPSARPATGLSSAAPA